MGNCYQSNCDPCTPDSTAINQLVRNAANYARQANTYSVNAENSATNAANSAIESENSAIEGAAAMQAILNEFEELYLGAKNADPTTDNQGEPLKVGALYWNTVINQIKVWDGISWNATLFNETTNFLAQGTTQPRSLTQRFSDIANILDYGADPTGVNDSTTAIQAATSSLIASGKPWVLFFPPGEYQVTDEINLDAATQPFAIIGSGRRRTNFRPTAFGAAKAIFAKRSGVNVLYITFKNFSIQPLSSSSADPYGLFFRGTSRLMISGISAASLRNTVIAAGPAFNSDWSNLEFFGCGYQPLWKEVSNSVNISTVNGSPTITASSNIFDASDLGQTVYVSQFDPGANQPSNSALVAEIISVNSPTSVTLNKNCFRTSSTRVISFDSVKGSISTGTNTLTLNAPRFSSSDIGRIISIDGALTGTGRIMVATIVSVINPTQCVLSEIASNTVSNSYVWFSPSIYVGQEITPSGQTSINDLSLNNIQIEQYQGPGLFLDEGTNVNCSILKFHGYDWNVSNYSKSREAMIVNSTSRSTFSQTMLTFGCVGINAGLIRLCYDNISTQFEQTTLSAVAHGDRYLFEFISDDPRCLLAMGSIIADSTDWSKMAGIIKTAGTNAPRKVVSGPYVSSFSPEQERFYAKPPAYAGQFRSIIPIQLQNNEAASFFPDRQQGFVLLSSNISTANGIYWFRVNSSPVLTQVFASADLDNTTGPLNGTTGAIGKATISAANDGKVYIENRLGTTQVFTLTFIGG